MHRRLLSGLALALHAFVPPALAQEQRVLTTNYTISLLGLPVGRASFETRLDAARYSVSGTLSSAGLAEFVSSTRGTSSVSGRIAGQRLFAERYKLAYTSDGKSWASDLTLRSGQVTAATVAPPPKSSPPADFLPVQPGHLRAVVDPLSGLMIKPSGDDLCRRTVAFFDGWTRLDLQLSPGGTRAFSTDGYKGDTTVCNVRIRPVSGYRTSSNGLKFLRKRTIEIAFAPIGDGGIFAPVRVRIPTEIGPLTLMATTFAKPKASAR